VAATPARAQSPKDMHELDSLKPLLATLPQDTTLVNVLYRIAWLYASSQLDSVRMYANDAKRLAEKLSFPRGVSKAMEIMTHSDSKSNIAQAFEAYMGNIRYNEEHGLTDLQGRVLEDIGYLHLNVKNYPIALDYMQRSLKVRQQNKDTRGIGMSYIGLGNIAVAMGDTNTFLRYNLQAKPLFEAIQDEDYIMVVLADIAEIYLQRGDTKQARHDILQALAMSERFNQKIFTIENLNFIAKTYIAERNFPKALSYIARAMQGAEAMALKNVFIIDCYALYADTYAGMGDYKRAFDYYRRYKALYDSVYSAESRNKISQLQIDYQMENKEKEAAKDQQIQRMTIIGLSGGGFALVVMLALAINRFRVKERANQEILRQQKVLEDQSVEIEITNTALHEKNLIIEEDRASLARERERSERLLLSVLPAPIAERMKAGETRIAEHFSGVTVLFADIVGFTKLSTNVNPQELVELLDNIFSALDALAREHGLEKIKTIGDAYMVVSGVPVPMDDHCERVARFALALHTTLEAVRKSWVLAGKELGASPVQMRVGIHTGEAVAGVIGTSKFSYDLWGDTVNTASRMESHGEAGKIHVSEECFNVLKHQFTFEERGEIEVKGKGVMRTWFLTGKMA
jgi:class 3 adenylate cyclase